MYDASLLQEEFKQNMELLTPSLSYDLILSIYGFRWVFFKGHIISEWFELINIDEDRIGQS